MGRIACLRFRRQLQRALNAAPVRGLDSGTLQTVQIPLTTFPVGQEPFGPITLSSDVTASVVIDRTVAGGLNALTSASTLTLDIQTSPDGGTTWEDNVAATFIGGAIPAKGGGNRTSDNVGVTGLGAGSEARVLVTVTGPSSVAVSGSVTVD